jgi:hypothetical protein
VNFISILILFGDNAISKHVYPNTLGMEFSLKKFYSLMVSQKVEKVCHFERQREIFLLNQLVLLRFLPLVEMTIGQFGLFARPSSLTNNKIAGCFLTEKVRGDKLFL